GVPSPRGTKSKDATESSPAEPNVLSGVPSPRGTKSKDAMGPIACFDSGRVQARGLRSAWTGNVQSGPPPRQTDHRSAGRFSGHVPRRVRPDRPTAPDRPFALRAEPA